MNLTYDVIQELKRHFIGGPSEPSRFWLAPAEGPQISCFGDGVSEVAGGYFLHFGPVPALSVQSRTVFVENSGQDRLRLALRNPNPWLRARWAGRGQETRLAGGEKAALELVFRSENLESRAYAGSVLLLGEGETGEERAVELGVRLTTFLDGAFGRFSFGGSPERRPHDFGIVDPAPGTVGGEEGSCGPSEGPLYSVTIDSVGSEPLRVLLEDLPDWLSAEIDGYCREGPAAGTFFERQAPVRLTLRPARYSRRLGLLTGRITLRSNDRRPAFRLLPLDLSMHVERDRPYLTSAEVLPVAVARPRRPPVEIHLANSGKEAARLELAAVSPVLSLAALPEVPGAGETEPGRAVIKGEISTEDLVIGPQMLELALRVRDGDPTELRIRLPVTLVEVRCTPDMLNFGALRGGERRERSIRFHASDDRALQLEARVMPEAKGFLKAEIASDGIVHVVCHLPAGEKPSPFDAAGLEVSDSRLGFMRHVRVRWEPAAGWRVRIRRLAVPALLRSVGRLGGIHAR